MKKFLGLDSMKKNLVKKFQNKKGFSLIELMVVVGIIGVLFVVLVPRLDFATDKAKTAGVQTDFRSISAGVEVFYTENSKLPTVDELNKVSDIKFGAPFNVGGSTNVSLSLGGVLDPWGNPYYLITDGTKMAVASKGPDKTLATDPLASGADDLVMVLSE